MKLRNLFGLSILVGGGYAAYKVTTKMKDLQASYDQVIKFGGDSKNYSKFDGDSIAVLFGGLEIDLTQAEMIGESATLKLHGEFCGIEVIVPDSWNIKVTGSYDKSGVDNKTDFNPEDTSSKLLVIEYDVKFAGLEIRYGSDEVEDVEEAEADWEAAETLSDESERVDETPLDVEEAREDELNSF